MFESTVPPFSRLVTVDALTIDEPAQSSIVRPPSTFGTVPDEDPLELPKPLLNMPELMPLLEKKPLLLPPPSSVPLDAPPPELPALVKGPPFDPPQLAAPTDAAVNPSSP